MPFGTVTINTPVLAGQGNGIISTEKGIITGAGLMTERIGLGNAEAFCQIFLVSKEAPLPILILLLASGYIGASSAIGWTGRIMAEPTFAVQGFVYNLTDFNFRMTVLTEVD